MDQIVKKQIMEKLYETEKTHHIKILFAIESGSRGWGFASPDSDYDCRFIYVHERDWYLSIRDKRDVIEYVADEIFDLNGWDLRKMLQHVVKSNAVILEWLSCNEVYIKNEEVVAELNRLAEEYFNYIHVTHHYLSLARKKLAEIEGAETGKLKSYFYVLRPLANVRFIETYQKIPPMAYVETLAQIAIDDETRAEIEKLLEMKKVATESELIEPNDILMAYFRREIEYYQLRVKEMQTERNKKLDLLYDTFEKQWEGIDDEEERVDDIFRKIIEVMWCDGSNS